MFWNLLVNFAIMAGGVLQVVAFIGGLLFVVLSIAYLFSDHEDGNLFWFVDDLNNKWNNIWEDNEND